MRDHIELEKPESYSTWPKVLRALASFDGWSQVAKTDMDEMRARVLVLHSSASCPLSGDWKWGRDNEKSLEAIRIMVIREC